MTCPPCVPGASTSWTASLSRGTGHASPKPSARFRSCSAAESAPLRLLLADGQEPVEPRRHRAEEHARNRDARDETEDREEGEREERAEQAEQRRHGASGHSTSLDFRMSSIGGSPGPAPVLAMPRI